VKEKETFEHVTERRRKPQIYARNLHQKQERETEKKGKYVWNSEPEQRISSNITVVYPTVVSKKIRGVVNPRKENLRTFFDDSVVEGWRKQSQNAISERKTDVGTLVTELPVKRGRKPRGAKLTRREQRQRNPISRPQKIEGISEIPLPRKENQNENEKKQRRAPACS